MSRIKVLVVVYNLDRAREHEWFAMYMDRNEYDLHFALVRKPEGFLAGFLESKGFPVYRYGYSGKSDLLGLTYKLYKTIRKERFDIVHTHLFETSITGMIASYLAHTPVRLVTRHHSDFHHNTSKLAVLMDKLVNKLAHKIVAVSSIVRKILVEWEGVPESKVIVIPHGIDVDSFGKGAVTQVRVSSLRTKYGLDGVSRVIGVVSRFIDWKGIQYIIPAFKELLQDDPDAVMILANASGPYENNILELLHSIPPRNYRLVKFEEDMPALYRLFDCFVHVPVSPTAEAFGQTYIEAMASEVPCVFTVSGAAHQLVENGVNCIVVPYKDANSIKEAIRSIFIHKDLNADMVTKARNAVVRDYGHLQKFKALDRLYKSLTGA